MISNRLSLTWTDIQLHAQNILRQMQLSQWTPDLVVGVNPGGLVASLLISNYLDVPNWIAKTTANCSSDSNLWLCDHTTAGKKILLVIDQSHTGATQARFKQAWVNSDGVASQWHDNVRWASCVHNLACAEDSDYVGMTVNRFENDIDINFPWESWWNRSNT